MSDAPDLTQRWHPDKPIDRAEWTAVCAELIVLRAALAEERRINASWNRDYNLIASKLDTAARALAEAQLRLNTEQQHRVEVGTVMRLEIALAEAQAERDSERRAHGQTIDQRDRAEEAADELAIAAEKVRADALQAERDLYRKKAHDWNAEADKYLARADEQTVRADAAERDYTECARGRIGDAEIIGRLMGEKDAAERALRAMREALMRAEQAIHSEYCTQACHPECVAVTAALASPPVAPK